MEISSFFEEYEWRVVHITYLCVCPQLLKRYAEASVFPFAIWVESDSPTWREILDPSKEDQAGYRSTRRVIAKNNHTPPEILKILSRDTIVVRRFVATNISTSKQTLDHLSFDEDYQVRSLVAKNPSTDISVLARLAREDTREEVLNNVIENLNTPEEDRDTAYIRLIFFRSET
jgi:hypothetical protein